MGYPDGTRCFALEEMLGRIFAPPPKPKAPPKRPFRVEYYKRVKHVPENAPYGKFAHSIKRFDTHEAALAFATEQATNVQVWKNGRWHTEYRRK